MMRRILYVFIGTLSFLISCILSLAAQPTDLPPSIQQLPAFQQAKLSPLLSARLANIEQCLPARFTLLVNDPKAFVEENKRTTDPISIVKDFQPASIFVVELHSKAQFAWLLHSNQIRFIHLLDHAPSPESRVANMNLNANKINWIHSHFPSLDGANQTVSIKEPLYDTTDLDIINRHISSALSSETSSSHATDMATIIAGAGNSSVNGRGVASAVQLTSSDFSAILPDPITAYQAYEIQIQNHSYGTDTENFYGALAHAYDVSANEIPDLLHIFSAGNNGIAMDTLGPYNGAAGFANITGNFKMAKNILTVGSVNEWGIPDPMSSKGPAYDGRVKPELVAFSTTGTSNAAALTSGVCILLSQHYSMTLGQPIPSSLLKAILINTADEVAAPGPDYHSGYGNLNAKKAMLELVNGHYFESSIQAGENQTYNLDIPNNVGKLKITCAWNDPASLPNASKALVNNLDMELEHAPTQSRWLPWVLNPYPQIDSLALPAKRAVDTLNNLELISVENPVSGTYVIHISAAADIVDPQIFHIAYHWEEKDQFEWTFPFQNENMPYNGEAQNYFRWESSYSNTFGNLEWSADFGNSWTLIADSIDLSTGLYQWDAPLIWSQAMARMTIEGAVFPTEIFTISHPLPMHVGFLCGDSVMLIWPYTEGIESYSLHSLGYQYLQEIATTIDTFIILPRNLLPHDLFALVPTLSNTANAVQSQTYDLQFQNAQCYINRFLATAISGQGVELDIGLGTTYKAEQLIFEKWTDGKFEIIGTTTAIALKNVLLDPQPIEGPNIYRSRLVLTTNQELVSEVDTVIYLYEEPLLIYPNPSPSGAAIQLFVNDQLTSEIHFQLFTASGQQLLHQLVDSYDNSIELPALAPGIYIYQLQSKSTHKAGKLLIR